MSEIAHRIEERHIGIQGYPNAIAIHCDRDHKIAIAGGLLQAFGGIAVLNGESQLIGSCGEVEELFKGNNLVFDSVKIHFQESHHEPIFLLSNKVGSALIPPLWEIHLKQLRPANPIDCVVEIRTGSCRASLAPEYSRPFCCNKLIVEG